MEDGTRRGGRTAWVLAGAGLAMLPWLVVLDRWLPAATRVTGWRTAWLGLDGLEGLALLATGALLGARVPHVFLLLAAMPPAFNILVLARVYDVRPALMRLLVVGATVPVVAVVALVAAIH